MNDSGLNDPATRHGLTKLAGQLAPLIQTRSLENLIGSDVGRFRQYHVLDGAMLANSIGAFEDILALGWTIGNAVRMADVQAVRARD